MNAMQPPQSIEEIKAGLETTEKGGVRQSIRNCLTVFQRDPLLSGAIAYNILTDRKDIIKPIGFHRESTALNDTDMKYLLLYLEETYGLTNEKKIDNAIGIVANENKYHPIRDYLNTLVWDGTERIRFCLRHFLGADADDYTYEALKLFLLGAISRAFQPGCKFEIMLCLVGGQGAGKSTFFRLLAVRDEWFSDDLRKLDDDNVYRKLQGHWIIEMSEMMATANAKSIEEIKSFLSRQKEVYKIPYETHPADRPRQCVFGGTSNEMLSAAERAEREYAAAAAAYVQTPADIVAQARAVQDQAAENSFSIYQLKGGNETLDYRFEPLDSIHRNGLSVKPENYELVYEAPLTAKDDLESIYTRFNVDRPADFTGHSLSVSDIVVLHQDGKDTAHYCDRVGFTEVPEFLQERQPELTPDDLETGERIRTPRGSFYVTAMSREQMEAAGYGVHHISDDGKYLIMGNGTRAFAVAAEQPEKDNPLRTAEMTLEDDYGMIDGVINNGRRGEELEKAQEYAERTTPEKPSIRERLEDAKRECAEHKPPEGKKPGRDVPEHDCL